MGTTPKCSKIFWKEVGVHQNSVIFEITYDTSNIYEVANFLFSFFVFVFTFFSKDLSIMRCLVNHTIS